MRQLELHDASKRVAVFSYSSSQQRIWANDLCLSHQISVQIGDCQNTALEQLVHYSSSGFPRALFSSRLERCRLESRTQITPET